MARGLGLAANALASGVSAGLGILQQRQQLQNQEDEQAYRAEDQAFQQEARGRQRSEWQRADEDRARDQDRREAAAVFEAINSGGPVSPEIAKTRVYQSIMAAGNPDLDKAEQTIGMAYKGEREGTDPEVIAAGDIIFAPEFQKRVGRVLDKDTKYGAVTVPKGAKIVKASGAGYYPHTGKDGQPDAFAVDMKLSYELPNGEIVEVTAPATEGMSSADDAPVTAIAYKDAPARLKQLRDIRQQLDKDGLLAKVRQQYALAGGDARALGKGDAEAALAQARMGLIGAQTEAARATAELAPVKAQAIKDTARAALIRAGKTGSGGAGGKDQRTAFERNAEFVAQTLFKGDKAQAVKYLNTAKNNPEAARLAGFRLAESERKSLSGSKQKEFDANKRAQEIANAIMISGTEPNAGADYSGGGNNFAGGRNYGDSQSDDDAFLDSVLGN